VANGFLGANVESGNQMAANFQQGGADLQAAVTKLTTFVNQSEGFWMGPGADKFRSEWASFVPQANKMIAAVQQDAPQAIKAAMTAISNAAGVS
jgi:uncharacterized protein YukE